MKIEIERFTDEKILRDFFKDKEIKDGLFAGIKKIPKELIRDDMICYLFKVDGKSAGFAVFESFLKGVVNVDAAFIKEFRGKIAIKISKIMLTKFFKEFDCDRISTKIYKKNKQSLIFALWLGFKKVITKSNYYWLELPYGRYI